MKTGKLQILILGTLICAGIYPAAWSARALADDQQPAAAASNDPPAPSPSQDAQAQAEAQQQSSAMTVPAQPDFIHHEDNSRVIDEVALANKKHAIQTLIPVLKTRRGSPDEPVLMVRVMEMDYDVADIEFRIANTRAIKLHAAPDLTIYKAYIRHGAELAGDFIRRFPQHSQIARVYYLRARGMGEIGNKDQAIADLRAYVDRYATTKDNYIAILGLSDMLIERKDYPTAIQYLNRLIKEPNPNSYAMALDRLAWVEYFVNDITAGLNYLTYEMRYYREHATGTQASMYQREKVLDAMALFYATAVDQHKPGYDANAAFKYFLSVAIGKELEKTLTKFAYLLRGKALDEQLEQLKVAVLNTYLPGVNTADLVALVFEHQLNRKRYEQINETAKELYGLMTASDREQKDKSPRYHKIVKILTDAAVDLQVSFTKNKTDLGYARGIAVSLTTIYDLLLRINVEDTAVSGKIHYNLAEIFFRFNEFTNSASHYRWVVEHASASWPAEMQKVAVESKLKAIGAYYEYMRTLKMFSQDITAKPLAENRSDALPAPLVEWYKWIDDYVATAGYTPAIENFVFEGNRLLYSRNHLQEALGRLNKFIDAAPSSQLAIPSATLVIDTMIATKNWDETYKVALQMLARKEWKGTPFAMRLTLIAGDAYFKRLEAMYAHQQYKEAIKGADDFLVLYPKSHFRHDAQALAANAAIAQNDKPLALQYFGQLKREGAITPEQMGTAHLIGASLAEEQYDLPKASIEYEAYLGLPQAQKNRADSLEKKKRVLLLAWISGDSRLLNHVLNSEQICGDELEGQCHQFELMFKLTKGYGIDWKDEPSRRGDVLWTVAALSARHKLPLKDKLQILERLSRQWGKQDPVITYSLMSHLTEILPHALREMRAEIRKATPIKLDKRRIADRTALIDKLENVASKLSEALPFVRLKVVALNEVANLYRDFANDLKTIPAPKGLTSNDLNAYRATLAQIGAPFATKSLQLREKALQLASDSGVDYAIFREVSVPAFQESPDLRNALGKGHLDGASGGGLEIARLVEVISTVPQERSSPARTAFVTAINSRKLPKALFMMQEAEKKNLMGPDELHLAKALVLDLAGARAEALSELISVKDQVTGRTRAMVLAPLAAAFFETYSLAKTQMYLKELFEQSSEDLKAAALGRTGIQIYGAAQWTGIKVPDSISLEIEAGAAATGRDLSDSSGDRSPAAASQPLAVPPQAEVPAQLGKEDQ